MAVLNDCLFPGTQSFVYYLHLTDFDQLRVVGTTIHTLSRSYEAHLLRCRIQDLSLAGEVTRIELGDALTPSHWTRLRSSVGWMEAGYIGHSLQCLQERLVTLSDMWNALRQATTSHVPTPTLTNRSRSRRRGRSRSRSRSRRRRRRRRRNIQ